MLEKVPQGGQMGMLYYWPTPQPPEETAGRTKHTLFQFINLHGTKHRPEAASSCCTPTNHRTATKGTNTKWCTSPLSMRDILVRTRGIALRYNAAATARSYIRRRFNALTVSALWRIDTGELNYERHV